MPRRLPATSNQRPATNRGGAPRGNLNAFKHGRRSPRVQARASALNALRNNPEVDRILKLDRRKRELHALAFRIFADLLLAAPEGQTTEELMPALMQKAIRRANNSMQTTGQPTPTGEPAPSEQPPENTLSEPNYFSKRHHTTVQPNNRHPRPLAGLRDEGT